MRASLALIGAILVLLTIADVEARKTGGGSSRRSGGWGFGSRGSSRTTPRPRPQSTYNTHSQSGGSNPSKIGWNVPNQKPAPPSAAKPSAPDVASKATATNVQSGYSPSGGYPRQPPSNPAYPSQGHPSSQTYNPAAGRPYNPAGGQPYNPSQGHPPPYSPPVYNQPSYGHPSMGQPSYGHPPIGQPSYGHSPIGQPSYGQPSFGHPSMGQPSYIPSSHPTYGAPQQPIILQQGSSRPGIGQLAKEALVFAGVSAGVNAAVNRIIPGGIYGTRSSGSAAPAAAAAAAGGTPTHTEITYNNYYYNGTAMPGGDPAAAGNPANPANPPSPPNAPGAGAPLPGPVAGSPPNPAPAAEPAQAAQNNAPANANPNDGKSNPQDPSQGNPNPFGYMVSDSEIKKLTDELFTKDQNNIHKYIKTNLQGQKQDESKTDDAPEPLLTVDPAAYEVPTVKAVTALYDNYELDVKTKEVVTSEKRREEDELLDKFLETDVMKITMKFLADKGFLPDDLYEFKDTLKRIWFSHFKRIDGDASSSGFEVVFLAEQFDSDIIGMHSGIYYAKQEAAKKINYLGYIKKLDLSDKGSVLKVRSTLNDVFQPATTIFVGTSPELEMALYTMCFFTRPNNFCPISAGGTDFAIITNRVNYFGKDILISGHPEI